MYYAFHGNNLGKQVCNSLMGGSKNTHTVHKKKTSFHSSFQNTTRTSLIFSVGEGRSDRSEQGTLYLFYSLYNYLRRNLG